MLDSAGMQTSVVDYDTARDELFAVATFLHKRPAYEEWCHHAIRRESVPRIRGLCRAMKREVNFVENERTGRFYCVIFGKKAEA